MNRNTYFFSRIIEYESVKNGILIHLFNTKKNKYVYDTVSGEILKISNFPYDILLSLSNRLKNERINCVRSLTQKYSKDKILEGLNCVETIKKREGLFKSFPKFEIVLNRNPERKAKFNHLILEVTRNCNFRCSYCIHFGNYKYERGHSGKNMSVDTARKAIDLFLKNSNSERDLIISFYGGEPLLRKELIIYCLKYAKSKSSDIKFTIQTNGYLLDKDFFDFIRKYDVYISISIDGPKHIHDRCRLLPSGKGTYERIISNLNELVKADKHFFRERVNISYTIPNLSYIEDLVEFHKNSLTLRECPNVSLNLINTIRLKDGIDLSTIANLPQNSLKHVSNLKPSFDRYIKGLMNKNLSGLIFEKQIFSRRLKTISRRKPINSKVKGGGLCSLSRSRLFVTVEEDLSFCERTYSIPSIGDLNNGITWEKIEQMEEDYLNNCNECYNCWAVVLCDICWAHLYSGKDWIDINIMKEKCEATKKRLDYYLKLYTKINEEYPSAIDNLMKPGLFMKKAVSPS